MTIMNENSPKRAVHFQKDVNPEAAGTLTYTVREDCTIQEAQFRFYVGQERQLKIRVRVMHNQDRSEDVIEQAGDESFACGDDDLFTVPVGIAVKEGEKIRLDYQNTSDVAGDIFTVNVLFILDYAFGQARTDIARVS